MRDLIDRQAAIEKIERNYREWGEEYGASDILCDISDLPSAEPAQKTGKWIHKWSGCGSVWLEQRCSECGVTFEEEPIDYNYCPNCGARME